MRTLIIFLSICVFGSISQAQMTDSEIVQTLISIRHTNIRESLNELGLTYVQKKQVERGENEMKYIFFIKGTEGNSKPWDIYTKKVSDNSIRITRIVIKYYYDNPGDIIELDRFLVPEEKVINGYIILFEKSEGKKQAHIDIKANEVLDIYNNLFKKTEYKKVTYTAEMHLFIRLLMSYNQQQTVEYNLNIYEKGRFTCSGLPENYLSLILYSNDTIKLINDNAQKNCAYSPVSNFSISEEDYNLLKESPILKIVFRQQNFKNEFSDLMSRSIIELIAELETPTVQ